MTLKRMTWQGSIGWHKTNVLRRSQTECILKRETAITAALSKVRSQFVNRTFSFNIRNSFTAGQTCDIESSMRFLSMFVK